MKVMASWGQGYTINPACFEALNCADWAPHLEGLHEGHDLVGVVSEAVPPNRHPHQADAFQRLRPQQLVRLRARAAQQVAQQRHHAVVVSLKVRFRAVRH